MPERGRTEAADFQVVLDERFRLADLAGKRVKVVALKIEARSPGEDAADVEALAFDLSEHVDWSHALGRAFVVRTAGSVNVMVARVESEVRRSDPSLEVERERAGSIGQVDTRRNLLRRAERFLSADDFGKHVVFRAARVLDLELTRRQEDLCSVVTVNLLLKEEVRREPFGLRRVDSPVLVADRKPRGRGLTVEISNRQAGCDRRSNVKQHGDFAAETDVLRSGSDVEFDGRFALAGFLAVDQRDGVFDLQAAQLHRHRRFLKEVDFQETVGFSFCILVVVQFGLSLTLKNRQRRPRVDRSSLRAADAKLPRDGTLVDHLDEERREASLLDRRLAGTSLDFDAHFRVERHDKRRVRVEQFLKLFRVAFLRRVFQLCDERIRQRSSQKLQRLSDPCDAGSQRLTFDGENSWRVVRGKRDTRHKPHDKQNEMTHDQLLPLRIEVSIRVGRMPTSVRLRPH